MNNPPNYQRVMLKVSGEALMGNRDYGLDTATCRRIAEDVKGVVELGVQVCLVIGGGNIFRGIAGAAAVSVVKKGLPVPPAKMTTRPFSMCRMARRRI